MLSEDLLLSYITIASESRESSSKRDLFGIIRSCLFVV